jgi:NAD+ synthase
MRNFQAEFNNRVAFIKGVAEAAGVSAVVFGNSGGKDAALVGILCRAACENTVGVIMPCGSARNYGEDREHAELLAERFGLVSRVINLTAIRDEITKAISDRPLSDPAISNIAPRLRMTALYALAAELNALVAGTGNRSERYLGYFTKWGDGAYDFNPIADLTATEVIEFLRFLGAPECITEKAPSAGLYEGQTDEAELGISYKAIDDYLLNGNASDADKALIERYHARTAHKRAAPPVYKEDA